MKDAILTGLYRGTVNSVVSIALFPLMLLAVHFLSISGVFAWAGFSEPNWRQMILLAAVAAFFVAS